MQPPLGWFGWSGLIWYLSWEGQREDYLHVSSDILLRTGPHGNLIWNWDIANASKGHERFSMSPARRKDLASTCVLHLQIVSVLQFLKTFWSVAKSGFRGREQV